jgi:hypothetical protein
MIMNEKNNMEQIPTAEELIDKTGSHEFWQEFHWVKEDLNDKMIEFARLHVQAALKIASESESDGTFGVMIYPDAILNSYPLENIK